MPRAHHMLLALLLAAAAGAQAQAPAPAPAPAASDPEAWRTVTSVVASVRTALLSLASCWAAASALVPSVLATHMHMSWKHGACCLMQLVGATGIRPTAWMRPPPGALALSLLPPLPACAAQLQGSSTTARSKQAPPEHKVQFEHVPISIFMCRAAFNDGPIRVGPPEHKV